MAPTLTDVYRYPIKSARGERLTSAVVEPWGLAGDRRWMVVDGNGKVITAREHPRLVLVGALIGTTSIRLTGPHRADLVVPVPSGEQLLEVSIWRSTLPASTTTPAADDWFSALLERPARLVYLDDPTRRATNPAHSDPGDRVSFADGYPLLLVTAASLAAVNDLIARGTHAAEGPVSMMRFRPNVVIGDSAAWAEDTWRRVRIGSAVFNVAYGCARCVLTTIDPHTALKGKEPLATLARHRAWAGATWFGINLIPALSAVPGDQRPTAIRIGDDVEVLARRE